MNEEGQGGGSGGSSTILNGGQQQQQQQAAQPIGHNDWLTEGKFSTGLSGRLPDDLKPYEGSIKKFEGTAIGDVLKSYGELEKKLGQRVQPPGPDAKPEEIATWRKTVGTPEKPEDYKIAKPENVPAELWNADLVKGFQEVAHGLHLSPAQAGKLAEWWNGQQMAAFGKHQQDSELADEREHTEAITALKTAWPENFDAHVTKANHGFKQLVSAAGMKMDDPAVAQVLNNPVVARLAHAHASLVSEDRQVTGGTSAASMTLNQQADDIQTNKANPLYAAYHGNEGPERQAQVADKIRRLRMGHAA